MQHLQGSLESWRPKKLMQFESKGCPLAELLFALGRSVFVLLRSSTD